MDSDEFAERLRNMNDPSGHYNVSVTDLLNDAFMSGHTNLHTLGDLVDVSGLQNPDDFGNFRDLGGSQ